MLYGPRREKNCLREFTNNKDRPACTSGQSDQCLRCSHFGKYHMLTCYRWNFNFLNSLCSWVGWLETRFVWNPEDRFCGDEANMKVRWCTHNYKLIQICLCFCEAVLRNIFHGILMNSFSKPQISHSCMINEMASLLCKNGILWIIPSENDSWLFHI